MRWSKAFAAWALIVVVESVLGTVRQRFIAPATGDMPARQIGVLTGSALVFAVACACVRWIGARSLREQLKVGLLWVALTIAFEFGLGAMLGYSRERMRSDYDLAAGGFMALGLLCMLLAPALAARARGMR